jgi:hypothetical protein
MFDLRKIFARELRARKDDARDPDSDYRPSGPRGEGLEVEYHGQITGQFRRWGLGSGCVDIEVRLVGKAPDGFDVFVGMVRLARWDRTPALRVLLGLPLLEAKVRKTVRATWLADFSHFGGLWLHTSERVASGPAKAELRELMMQLAPPTPSSEGAGCGQGAGPYPGSSFGQDASATTSADSSTAATAAPRSLKPLPGPAKPTS